MEAHNILSSQIIKAQKPQLTVIHHKYSGGSTVGPNEVYIAFASGGYHV